MDEMLTRSEERRRVRSKLKEFSRRMDRISKQHDKAYALLDRYTTLNDELYLSLGKLSQDIDDYAYD